MAPRTESCGLTLKEGPIPPASGALASGCVRSAWESAVAKTTGAETSDAPADITEARKDRFSRPAHDTAKTR